MSLTRLIHDLSVFPDSNAVTCGGASNLLLVTFLIPVSAIMLGVGFLGETLQLQNIAGMAVIGSGLAVIDGRLLPRLRKSPTID